ncbi:hypothetical protein [Streptomyces sp. HUAS TT7]|uniref:hypothetical protein n=1 Tax=Streptomyces sp. HUAS TT7 TaxID=3447507 RepID=UPI003F65B9E2
MSSARTWSTTVSADPLRRASCAVSWRRAAWPVSVMATATATAFRRRARAAGCDTARSSTAVVMSSPPEIVNRSYGLVRKKSNQSANQNIGVANIATTQAAPPRAADRKAIRAGVLRRTSVVGAAVS